MAHRPYTRGVSHLMYIGDVITQPTPMQSVQQTVFTYGPIVGAAYVAWKSKGLVRLAAILGGGYWYLKQGGTIGAI